MAQRDNQVVVSSRGNGVSVDNRLYGYSGYSGHIGISGYSGTPGSGSGGSGYSGISGFSGAPGSGAGGSGYSGYSGYSGSGSSSSRTITQNLHGLIVGNIVRFDGIDYIKAQADIPDNADVIGIVSTIIDVNRFVLITSGYVNGLVGLTTGLPYFLSRTVAGALVDTDTLTAGEVSKPILVAISSTEGYLINWRGVVIIDIPEEMTAVTVVNISTLLDLTYSTVLVNAAGGPVGITLPTAVGISGKRYYFKKIEASLNVVTIVPQGVQTIDGVPNYTLILLNDFVTIISDGTNWQVQSN
jgi:hypothetical protein